VVPTPFSEQRDALVADESLRGPAFGRAFADLVDEWLVELLGDAADVALIGGGALGRRELAPQSDLDLVLLHRGRRDIASVAEQIWYPIWDARVVLDHSVRTPSEALAMAGSDLKVVLSLLDGRAVAGDVELADEILGKVRNRWISTARKRVSGLHAITRDRHAKEGDLAYLLEPDVKQSKGGLRDLRVLHALAVGVPVVHERPDIAAVSDTLLNVRVELHRMTGRPSDRLLLEYQDEIAERLDYADADMLMVAVAGAGRVAARAYDDATWRAQSWIAGPRGRSGGRDKLLSPGVVLRDGEVDISDDGDLADPSLLLRAAEQAALLGVRFAERAHVPLARAAGPGDPWPATAQRALLGMLGAGENLVAVVDALDELGLMIRILPEWEAVRSRPQRNAFHRFTVDRHLVEAVVQASKLTRQVSRPDLLLVGAWLHDLGKGFPGDHTEAGVELMRTIAQRMGFTDHDVETLVALVQYHLLLPSIATSRDLSDPTTIDAVADAVGTRETLELLAALTEADSIATGQSGWTAWKAELLARLVAAVDARLAGEEVPANDHDAELLALLASARPGEVVLDGGSSHLDVVAPDRVGLMNAVVGTLALQGLDVVRVEAWSSSDGTAVERIDFEASVDRAPEWNRLQCDVADALDGAVDVGRLLAERASRYARRSATAARPAELRVLHHQGAARDATVLEVRAADELGLLYRLTKVLGDLGLTIVQAHVVTLGHEAVDSFYVRDAATGHAVEERADEIVGEIRRSLL
jgi:[protein-PII] uridylyltransferase